MLASNVREEILRGVRLDRVLEGFGAHWSRSSGYTPEEEYEVSQPVAKLNDFISHDWETGSWPKFLNLVIIYNVPDAAIASTTITVVLAVLAFGRHVPEAFPLTREQVWEIGGVTYR